MSEVRTVKARPMKKKRIDPLNLFLFLLFVVLAMILVIWLLKTSLKADKTPIRKNDFSSLILAEDSSSQEEKLPADELDTELLRQNFGYLEIYSSQLNDGILAPDDPAESGELQPIYNALFTPKGLQIASLGDTKLKCRSDMVNPLSDMLNAFYDETGLRTIMINEGYAPEPEIQEQYPYDHYDIYGNYLGYYSDEPDVSSQEESKCVDHESGYAIDLGLYINGTGGIREFTGEGIYEWFGSNAYKYGFILSYPEDKEDITGKDYTPSHFRYVGKAEAAFMHENNLCLEEFYDIIRGYSFDRPLIVQTSEGSKAIYYIGDSGLETTQAQVSMCSDGTFVPYLISGNGTDGYIITVSPTEEFSKKTDSGADTETDSSMNGDMPATDN